MKPPHLDLVKIHDCFDEGCSDDCEIEDLKDSIRFTMTNQGDRFQATATAWRDIEFRSLIHVSSSLFLGETQAASANGVFFDVEADWCDFDSSQDLCTIYSSGLESGLDPVSFVEDFYDQEAHASLDHLFPHIFIADRWVLEPQFRGRGIGVIFANLAIDKLSTRLFEEGGGCLVLYIVSPLDQSARPAVPSEDVHPDKPLSPGFLARRQKLFDYYRRSLGSKRVFYDGKDERDLIACHTTRHTRVWETEK